MGCDVEDIFSLQTKQNKIKQNKTCTETNDADSELWKEKNQQNKLSDNF